jgi:hypothetical protein
MASLSVPLDLVPLFPYDRGESVPLFDACVDQLRHPCDLHLLHDDHEKQSKNSDGEKKRTDPEPLHWSPEFGLGLPLD